MKKIIFIDDNPTDHFILKRILNRYKLDYEVDCTANVMEVVDLLKINRLYAQNLPDIILLDLYMPSTDGWDFLEKVKDIYPHLAKPLRIYMLSSSINPRDIEHAKRYPFVRAFIFKPITKEVLERYIDEENSTL
jgi:CheY-like chemotaxis protein